MMAIDENIIREKIKKYFSISELVGSHTVSTYGEKAWRFLDYRALHALLIVREGIGKSVTVNHGGAEQRGLRTNIQPLVKNKTLSNKLYISAHIQGKAFDFDVEGMTAQEVRDWITAHSDLFPFKIRLEEDGNKITWVHMDVIYEEKNPKVYKFKP